MVGQFLIIYLFLICFHYFQTPRQEEMAYWELISKLFFWTLISRAKRTHSWIRSEVFALTDICRMHWKILKVVVWGLSTYIFAQENIFVPKTVVVALGISSFGFRPWRQIPSSLLILITENVKTTSVTSQYNATIVPSHSNKWREREMQYLTNRRFQNMEKSCSHIPGHNVLFSF